MASPMEHVLTPMGQSQPPVTPAPRYLSFRDDIYSQQNIYSPRDTRPAISPQTSSVVALPSHDPGGDQTSTVIVRIESILEHILDGLLKGDTALSIPYRSRTTAVRSRLVSGGNYVRRAASSHLSPATRSGEVLRFPGRTRHEGKKFGT